MRRAILLAALVTGACFDVRHLDGTPCSSDGACPSDQSCGSDGLCHGPDWTPAPPDGGRPDATDSPDAAGPSPDAAGPGTADARIAPRCGDGAPGPGEECDDGNGVDADGCDIDCTVSVVVQVSVGMGYPCARFDSGVVRCWVKAPGSDAYVFSVDATPIALGGRAVQVSAGAGFACAVLEDGAVRCWGENELGQLGYGTTDTIGDDEDPSSMPPVVDEAVQVSAGLYHACAVLADGAVRCWGDNNQGQLGYGTTARVGDDEPVTVDVPLGGPAVQVSAGGLHTCARLFGGAVRCWGDGADGALGYGNPSSIGDDEPASAAGDVPLGEAAFGIVAGGDYSCALLSGGRVRCWGDATDGKLGYGNLLDVGDDEVPTEDVDVGEPVATLAAGADHVCVRTASEGVRCWGANLGGALGYGHTDPIGDDEVPATAGDVDVGAEVLAIEPGSGTTCALIAGGTLRCWGANTDIGDDETPAEAGAAADVRFW